MSSNKQTYKGKKWCEYCKTGINWTKEDIAYHEQSKMHKKNVEREIEFKRGKIIREQEQAQKQGELTDTAKMMQEIEKKAQEAMMGSSKLFQNQKNANTYQNYNVNAGGIGPQMPVFQQVQELTEEQKKELKRQKKKEELGSEFGSSYEESDTDDDEEQFPDEEIGEKNDPNKVDFVQKFDRGNIKGFFWP